MRIKLALIGALLLGLNFSTVSLPVCADDLAGSQVSMSEQTSKKYEFSVVGNAKGAFYKQILGEHNGKSVNISIKRFSSYVDAGGFMVETNPTFKIAGDFGTLPLNLEVKSEDLIANVGGMNVQTGVIYHVSGKLGAKEVQYQIDEKETITNMGGINVQTDVWNVLTSKDKKTKLAFESVSEISDFNGLKVETGRYNTLKGKDAAGKVNFKINSFSGDVIDIQGSGSDESLALLLALRPFINI
ncbi:MAG: hypothetical protein HQM10_17540 [Candidatus Riflebacteria bacterium]|nr:hypothetical protein [Candidatus Riflebacteria bacterium]